MASWNSFELEITYQVLGWTAFVAWSFSFYPQVILNFRRKSPAVQKQYFEKYGYGQMIPVAANDVAFSIHAVLLTSITLFQIVIYERGTQKVNNVAIGIVSAVWLFAAACFLFALPNHSWLWLISIFRYIQVLMTVIKYIPQTVMNFMRKSTEGFSIGYLLLDFIGGITNYLQMAMQSIDQRKWLIAIRNSHVCIFFDVVFMLQHWVIYPPKEKRIVPSPDKDGVNMPLVKPSDQSSSSDNFWSDFFLGAKSKKA